MRFLYCRKLSVASLFLSDIVNGKRAISADTALRLGKYFDVSPETWLNLQIDYELRVARRTTWANIEPHIKTRAALRHLPTFTGGLP
jgi:plasmid maintenance system antidote protein VapI